MGLLGRASSSGNNDGGTTEIGVEWPEGWTDDELRALAADVEPHARPGCPRHGQDAKVHNAG